MLTVVHDAQSANESDGAGGRSLLDEIVRDGARQMLAAALRGESPPMWSSSPITSTRTAAVWWSALAITTSGRC
jgi:hypothetical protein